MSGRKLPAIPLLLVFLALADLKSEIRLLLDHFTFTTLLTAVQSHLLAVTVLLLLPSLWRLYQRDQG
ncbi:MAG: hypothetical protein VKK99_01690 [Cyanobacteriota bacterium]|nr:hypothetical protein [Cyanobacteriota bacterium]